MSRMKNSDLIIKHGLYNIPSYPATKVFSQKYIYSGRHWLTVRQNEQTN